MPTPPTGEQKQTKRTFDVLPKPANLISYRQHIGCSFLTPQSERACRFNNLAQRLKAVRHPLCRFAEALDVNLDVTGGDVLALRMIDQCLQAMVKMSQLSATVINVRRKSCTETRTPHAFATSARK